MLNKIFETGPDYLVTGRCNSSLFRLINNRSAGIYCGKEDYVDMSSFSYYRARDIGLLANCHDCRPLPDTFERLVSAVDPEEIER